MPETRIETFRIDGTGQHAAHVVHNETGRILHTTRGYLSAATAQQSAQQWLEVQQRERAITQ